LRRLHFRAILNTGGNGGGVLKWPFRATIGVFFLILTAVGGATGRALAAGVNFSSSGVPVVVIVMENRQYKGIVGNTKAPFINGTMIAHGVLDTNYIAGPGSLPDYMMMTSGQTSNPTSAPNIFAALGTATSWREFEESMPSVCYPSSTYGVVTGSSAALYTKYHNPAMQYTSVSGTSLCNNVVPLSPGYFDPSTLPPFSYVVPNQCNDMHTLPTTDQCPTWNGGTNTATSAIQMGDNWLASFVPAIAQVATVILTWDEGSPSNEQVVTVAYGAGVSQGQDGTAYTHASLEAALYSYFGLGTAPGAGATATPLPIP
jgi:hypothetical protein